MKNVKRKSVAMMLAAAVLSLTIFAACPATSMAAGEASARDPYPDLEWWDNMVDPESSTVTVTSDEATGYEGYTVHSDFSGDGWVPGSNEVFLTEGYTGTITFECTSAYKELDYKNTIWTYTPASTNVSNTKNYFVTSGIENTEDYTRLTVSIKNYDKGGMVFSAWTKYNGNKKWCSYFTIEPKEPHYEGYVLPEPKSFPSVVDPNKQPGGEVVNPEPTPEPVPSPAPTDSPIIEESADGSVVVKDSVDATGKSKVSKEVISEGTMYRMYDPNRGEHMYTKNAAEMQQLVSLGWQHEASSDFNVIAATEKGATPVYRVYNPNDGGMHFYTQNAAEAKGLAAGGWTYEGISHYVYSKDSGLGTPQYRLYNPNSTNGEHNWTTSVAERDALIAAGWQSEGVCWNIK